MSSAPDRGITAVLVLAESHLSLHTWPEHRFAAADMYTCGRCEPHRADEILRIGLAPRSVCARQIVRGGPVALVVGSRVGW
jgi:S-adenosylmethionine decarboxylase